MKNKEQVYQEIKNKIILALEKIQNSTNPTKQWVMPWYNSGSNVLPINYQEIPYQGINTLLLLIEKNEKGYLSPQWMTYNQAKKLNGQVKKGEKSTQIIFYKPLLKPDLDESGNKQYDNDGELKLKTVHILKTYNVFNRDQIDNLPKINEINFDKSEFNKIELAEQLLFDTQVKINEGGNRAFYNKITDQITMPDRFRFDSSKQGAENYYSTVFHELTHSTMHHSRCDRIDKYPNSTNKSYAFEELIAELGAVFLKSRLQISGHLHNHDSYLNSWLQLLKEDKTDKLIFEASAAAQKAVDWVESKTSVFKQIDNLKQAKTEKKLSPDFLAKINSKFDDANEEINRINTDFLQNEKKSVLLSTSGRGR